MAHIPPKPFPQPNPNEPPLRPGHPCDYAAWEAAGAEGWGWPDVAPYFKRMENWAGPSDASGLRGRSGPLHVKDGDNALRTPLFSLWAEACEQAGYGRVEDYNGVRQEGGGPMPMTVFHSGPNRGQRCSTAAAYLEPAMARTNLEVLTNAAVARVVWKGENEEGGDEGGVAGQVHPAREWGGRTEGKGGEEANAVTRPRAVGVELVDGRRSHPVALVEGDGASQPACESCGPVCDRSMLRLQAYRPIYDGSMLPREKFYQISGIFFMRLHISI